VALRKESGFLRFLTPVQSRQYTPATIDMIQRGSGQQWGRRLAVIAHELLEEMQRDGGLSVGQALRRLQAFQAMEPVDAAKPDNVALRQDLQVFLSEPCWKPYHQFGSGVPNLFRIDLNGHLMKSHLSVTSSTTRSGCSIFYLIFILLTMI
jgi:hypothetical protein